MKIRAIKVGGLFGVMLSAVSLLTADFDALAADNAALVSMSVPTNAQVWRRTVFAQTWTIKNTGTTTWSPGAGGYTLNMVGLDTLGAIPVFANSGGTYPPSAIIGSGKSVASGAQATFTIDFIAPEGAGSYTDTFQLNGTNNFGPLFTVSITVPKAGSTNQYDRCRAISYANNYAGYVVRDGYFWTNESFDPFYGTNYGISVPTSELGDDCAHFVSSCIGEYSALWGGGISIPSRTSPAYGEPAATRLVVNCLIDPGYAVEVSSLSQMEPGDVIGWNWEGNTEITNLEHVTLYLGNNLTASHAISALDVSANTYFQGGEPDYVRHLIHIFDAPTVTVAEAGKEVVLSWGTNWSGYSLYSASSLSSNATWTKVTTSPKKIGALDVLSNAMGSSPLFYRLMLP